MREKLTKDGVAKALGLGLRRGPCMPGGSDSEQRSMGTRWLQPITGHYILTRGSLPPLSASTSQVNSTAKPEWRKVHVEKKSD